MKWKDVMDAVKRAGIKDDDEIWFIDIGSDNEISVYKDPVMGWSIS